MVSSKLRSSWNALVARWSLGLKTMANLSIQPKWHRILYRAPSRMRRLAILASILCVALRAEWIMNDNHGRNRLTLRFEEQVGPAP